MRNLKILLLISIVFLLSGCTVHYKARIDENKKVFEQATVKQEISKITGYNKDYLESMLDANRQRPQLGGYRLSAREDKKYAYGAAEKQFKSLNEYSQSGLITMMFSGATTEEKDGTYLFNTLPLNSESGIFDVTDPNGAINQVSIHLQFYNEVLENNADEVDSLRNIYTWKIKAEDKDRIISFKLGTKVKYEVKLFVFLEQNLFTIVAISSILLIGLIVFLYTLQIRKRNNQL